MRTIDLLRDLQANDSALDTDRERLPQVESELADRSEYQATRTAYALAQAASQKASADQRDRELDLESQRTHLKDVEAKLYGGRVRDARELSNLSKEADQLRSLIGTREDRLIELLDAAERATAELTEAETRLRRITAERRSQEAALKAERDQLRARIAAEEARSANLREQVPPAALRTYDSLRRTRGGLAVVEVRQRTCQGCRIALTVGEEQRLRHGDTLVQCQSCNRILYSSY